MEHATSSIQPHHHHVCVYPPGVPVKKHDTLSTYRTATHTRLSATHIPSTPTSCGTLCLTNSVSHPCSHTSASLSRQGKSSLAVRKCTTRPSWRKIPYHFIPHTSLARCRHIHIVRTSRLFPVTNA